MKSLLGAGVLVALMSAGALSSDAMSGFDAPDTGTHEKQADKKADREADKDVRRAERAARRAGKSTPSQQSDKPDHPLGAPPGQQQRGRREPPAWAGSPDERTAEPPGLASTSADHPSKTHGRP